MPKNYILLPLIIAVMSSFAYGQDKWNWSKSMKNQKLSGYYPAAPKKVFYTDELQSRADRNREPTTRKPLPGELPNEDIDDYPDNNDQSEVKQNSPYLPGGGNSVFGGQFGGGFNQYPQYGGGSVTSTYPGNPANGILVGPGGPTGVIGRPQAPYPVSFPGQSGYPGYSIYNTQPFGGAISSNFPAYNGFGFHGQQPAYPDIHQQFPVGAGQYAGVSPQYTEGYGFSNLQPQPNPQQPFNDYPPGKYSGYPNGEYRSQTNRKNSNIKTNQKQIDDKIVKNPKTRY